MIDVHQSISDQDLQIISLCLTSGKPIVIGLNKSENLSKTDKFILKKDKSIAAITSAIGIAFEKLKFQIMTNRYMKQKGLIVKVMMTYLFQCQ